MAGAGTGVGLDEFKIRSNTLYQKCEQTRTEGLYLLSIAIHIIIKKIFNTTFCLVVTFEDFDDKLRQEVPR